MKSRTAGRASREVERIDQWWRANRDHRELFIDEFESTVRLIEQAPHIGRLYEGARREDVRYLVMRKTRYHLFYVVEDNQVVIVCVWGAERGRRPKL